MGTKLCIHGHFYQPPRQDPWLGCVLPEGSAAPGLNWNERICRESYAPLAFARRLDGRGRITELVNCYSKISFNAGPTLMAWLEEAEPSVHARLVEADKDSARRFGHGSAMAQIYHHVIMPLASPLDKEVEVAWGVMDFEARFGRKPEGMWLSEAAVDVPSMEALAAAGIRFILLAPRQARAVRDEQGVWRDVDEGSLDIYQPYGVELPSGRSLAVFFYHGGLSQAVAFEGLLRDGEAFWKRIQQGARPGLLTLGTDGETYGHHFTFGEMALAYVLAQADEGRDGLELTNLASYLAENPPTRQVRLHEPSSWSCVHGVERWRSDCGCSTGGHPGWNQQWRAPLRRVMDGLKQAVDKHFFEAGRLLFREPKQALIDYGRTLAKSQAHDDFAASHFLSGISSQDRTRAWKLLAMQQWALAGQASCAWFFDEVSRIEPLNALTFGLRAAELAAETGGPGDLERMLEQGMAEARSNDPRLGTGLDLFRDQVLPRRETPTTLVAQALLSLRAKQEIPMPGDSAEIRWPLLHARVNLEAASDDDSLWGALELALPFEAQGNEALFFSERFNTVNPLQSRFRVSQENGHPDSEEWRTANELPWNKRQALALLFAEHAARKERQSQDQSAALLAGMFLPPQEAQQTQNQAVDWLTLWPGLARAYVEGLELPEEQRVFLADFLRRPGPDHPGALSVARDVEERAMELLRQDYPPHGRLTAMVRRCRELDLPVNWWHAQNLVWALDASSEEARELRREFGFSEA